MVEEERSSLVPTATMRPEILGGRDPVYPGVDFMPPLSD